MGKTVFLLVCVITLSYFVSGFPNRDGTGTRKLSKFGLPNEDKKDGWRFQRQYYDYEYRVPNFPIPRPFPPPPYFRYYSSYYPKLYNPNPPTSNYPDDYPGPNDFPSPRFGDVGTGIAGATGECVPGIPKCAPRIGR